MGFALSENEILIVTAGVVTVAAILLAIVYTVRKQRSLALGPKEKKPNQAEESKETAESCAADSTEACEGEAEDDRASDEPNWNTKDPEEMAKILRGLGGGNCPVLHGLPHFSKIGGKWPPEKGDFIDPSNTSGVADPKEYCDHIPGQVKRTQQRVAQKKIEESMGEDDKAREREVQRQQLEAIYKLMEDEKDKFGLDTMDDIQNQMGLYVQ